jgi:hypothetical protein
MRGLTTATGETTVKSFKLWQFNVELRLLGATDTRFGMKDMLEAAEVVHHVLLVLCARVCKMSSTPAS